MMDDVAKPVSIVALHEAGHAVVAAYLRIPYSRVTVKPKAFSGGHVTPINRRMPRTYEAFEMQVLNRASRRLPVEAIAENADAIVQRAMDRAFSNRRRGLQNAAIMILAARAVVSKYVPKDSRPEWHYKHDESQLREIAVSLRVKKGCYKAWRASLYEKAQEIINDSSR